MGYRTPMPPETTILIGFYVVFLLSVTCHEAAHAWAAKRLGDSTAYLGGQVSLDPMPHIRREPIGMVLIPIASLLMIGWPLGFAHVPVDPRWAERYPKRAAWMSLAGPAANLILLIVACVGIRVGLEAGWFAVPDSVGGEWSRITIPASESAVPNSAAIFLSLLFVENLVLLLFNLIPLPPMDGAGALPLAVPAGIMRRFREAMAQPMVPFMSLAAAWMLFPKIFDAAFTPVINIVYSGVAHYGG